MQCQLHKLARLTIEKSQVAIVTVKRVLSELCLPLTLVFILLTLSQFGSKWIMLWHLAIETLTTLLLS